MNIPNLRPLVIIAGALRDPGSFGALRGRSVAIIADSMVARVYGSSVRASLRSRATRVELLTFPPGERAKTRATWARLTDTLLRLRFDRDAVIVGLGGGVSLDIAGFVAATFLRGIAWLACPTSLLAMVDAAHGGKTGVNTPAGKNLVGAFYPPLRVIVDTQTLATLPARQWRCGMAELIKHALVGDARLFRSLERQALVPGPIQPTMLARAIAVKQRIVARDPFEQGERAVLNAGHTVAHAIERASSYRVPHGLAVAVGLAVEARLAMALCGFSARDYARLTGLLARAGLPILPQVSFQRAAPFFLADKKTRGGTMRCALPQAIGTMAHAVGTWTVPVSPRQLAAAWNAP
jgi:3-dehydroquinate synthase